MVFQKQISFLPYVETKQAKRYRALAAACFLVSSSYFPNTVLAATSLIVNGDFESPGVASGALITPIIPGWTGVGDSIEIGPAATYGAVGSTQLAELDANRTGTSNTGFYQLVPTSAGAIYELSLTVAARPGVALTTNTVEVWWRNQKIGTIDPSSTGWQLYKFNVQGSGGSDRLEFREQAGDDDGAGGLIDNVSLTLATNLVVNGSFETGSTIAPSITGWTGIIDNVEVGSASTYGVIGATGALVAELDAYALGKPGAGISQTITTQAQSYTLSLDVAARSGTSLPDNIVEVRWRGQYLGLIRPQSNTFTTYSFTVQGSGGTDLLEFIEPVGTDNGLGGIIDNVRLFSNAVAPAAAPDLSVKMASPTPALAVNALSQIPVTLSNMGTQAITTPLTLKVNTYADPKATLKFAAEADKWVCLRAALDANTDQFTCTYSAPLAQGASTTVRLPFTPSANMINWKPGPFSAQVTTAIPGEINTMNNTSASMMPTAAVTGLTLGSMADPLYSKPILNPTSIPKYAMPLPNAFASFFRHTPNTTAVAGTDSYNITIKQINSQILPPGFPSTPVYAYGDPARPDSFSYPAHTIVANSTAVGSNALGAGKPVKVKFTDSRPPNTTHLLPIDRSIHGAMAGEPDIRSIAHLHGIKNINQNSDGYPEGWSSPNGQIGNQFTKTSPTVGYNANPFDYANSQESTLLWYHDHTLGMTRLNVYSGLAGLYLLRDSNEQTLINNNALPNGAYEIPLVLQDRTFGADGSLAYPDLNPAVPTAPKTSMVPEFYGNVMVVNGVSWPFLEVEPRKYRFRVLNGSSSRFYTLKLSNNANFQVIGTEGGFLNAPATVNTITMGPAERYDIVVDFSTMNGQTITVTNSANSPFPGGIPVVAGLDDQIMQFRVNQPLSTVPNNPLPVSLRTTPVTGLTPTVAAPRQVLLAESTDNNGRILPILGTVANGILGWMDTVTETPKAGSIETWEIYNDTVDAHPIHLHGGHFQIVNRQAFAATVGTNHALTNISFPTAAVLPGAPEKAWKDTVISYPGQVTRINVKFENAGLFVWHCHILEHEDHDMMRPMLVQ